MIQKPVACLLASCYDLPEMSRPLESFEFLNRGGDERLLEGQSLRSVFIVLLVNLFMLGMLTSMMLYDVFHLHRFSWTNAGLILGLAIPVFRLSRLVYRRLGSDS
jgi:hypothetical protein